MSRIRGLLLELLAHSAELIRLYRHNQGLPFSNEAYKPAANLPGLPELPGALHDRLWLEQAEAGASTYRNLLSWVSRQQQELSPSRLGLLQALAYFQTGLAGLAANFGQLLGNLGVRAGAYSTPGLNGPPNSPPWGSLSIFQRKEAGLVVCLRCVALLQALVVGLPA